MGCLSFIKLKAKPLWINDWEIFPTESVWNWQQNINSLYVTKRGLPVGKLWSEARPDFKKQSCSSLFHFDWDMCLFIRWIKKNVKEIPIDVSVPIRTFPMILWLKEIGSQPSWRPVTLWGDKKVAIISRLNRVASYILYRKRRAKLVSKVVRFEFLEEASRSNHCFKFMTFWLSGMTREWWNRRSWGGVVTWFGWFTRHMREFPLFRSRLTTFGLIPLSVVRLESTQLIPTW